MFLAKKTRGRTLLPKDFVMGCAPRYLPNPERAPLVPTYAYICDYVLRRQWTQLTPIPLKYLTSQGSGGSSSNRNNAGQLVFTNQSHIFWFLSETKADLYPAAPTC
uniref:Uncharacterized protein n=1 Tax=Entomoneis paludosa TaxID=265537 RepID=A0A7S2YMF5_9STRA